MDTQASESREGGIKVVFDVPEADADDVSGVVAAAGFSVRRYYGDEEQHGAGTAAPGWIRLGAEQPMTRFTKAEQESIVATFDAVQRESGFTCSRCGTDVWTAGHDTAAAGVRAARRPPLT